MILILIFAEALALYGLIGKLPPSRQALSYGNTGAGCACSCSMAGCQPVTILLHLLCLTDAMHSLSCMHVCSAQVCMLITTLTPAQILDACSTQAAKRCSMLGYSQTEVALQSVSFWLPRPEQLCQVRHKRHLLASASPGIHGRADAGKHSIQCCSPPPLVGLARLQGPVMCT